MRQFLLILTLSLGFCSTLLDQGLGLDGMQVGGAYTANPKSVSAIYWNPACLPEVKNNLYFSTNRYFNDLTNTTFMLNVVYQDCSVGLGYIGLNVTDVPYLDNNGNSIGNNFTFSDQAIILALGYKFNTEHSIGGSCKAIIQNAITSKTSYGFDLGYKLKLNNVHLGLVAETEIITTNISQYKVRLGTEYQLFDFNLSTDLVYDSLFKNYFVNYGMSYTINPLFIKVGVNGYLDTYFLGISIKLDCLILDYMYSNQDLGLSHRFGLGITL